MEKNICKTVCQYNSRPISDTDMKKLLEIAADYGRVKNYVYARYGGIRSLSKIYPGYTVQNEMTQSGLRGELGLPAVYFYLAIFDALGDIKSQWTGTKMKVLELVSRNENLTSEEKHYLRFLLKVGNAFEAVLNHRAVSLPEEIQKRYEGLAECVDSERMHRYLWRQVRKYHRKLHSDMAQGFSISERAYRYKDHGIYISIKEKRKRIFIPLTDNNKYDCQLYARLYPDENNLEIRVPIYMEPRSHEDYTRSIGVSMGIQIMLTADNGNRYGEELGRYQTAYAEWIREQAGSYRRNRANNPGRKKYNAKKKRLEEQLHSYIGQELNRFLKTEKPRTIYMIKLSQTQNPFGNKAINHSVNLWQRGYIRRHLLQKCREQSIELVEVLGKDISRECSQCGAIGKKKQGEFFCESCGYHAQEKENAARNTLKRGMEGKTIH